MAWSIYLVTCVANSKVYVGLTGKSVLRRWRRHMTEALSGQRRMVFHAAIRKHGVAAFVVTTLDTCSTRTEANLCEQRWIAHYQSTDRSKGYNVDPGGTFHGMSPDARRKMSERNLERWAAYTPEQRAALKAKMLKARAGKMTPEVREKISASLKEWNAAKTPEEKAALEARRHLDRRGDAEPRYGAARSYKPKPPRTAEERRESLAKCRDKRSASMRETLAAMSPEEKRRIAAKRWETRRARFDAMSPEEREAKRLARKPKAPKSPEENAAILAKSWEKRRANAAAGVQRSAERGAGGEAAEEAEAHA